MTALIATAPLAAHAPVALDFNKVDADGCRRCGPYTLEPAFTAGGNRKGFDVLFGDQKLGTGRTADAAAGIAMVHHANQGCPVVVEVDDVEPVIEETDGEVLARIQERFRVMEKLVSKTIAGAIRSLIISGPGGIGKSHPTKRALAHAVDEGVIDTYVEVSGSMSAIGLYKALWACKDGGVLLIDDCDSVFEQVDALNILKAALDSSDRRVLSWMKQATWMEEEGIESQFEFRGQVIFISNIDFEVEIDRGTKRSAHLEALLSRSLYLDLDISSTRDLLIRIEDMVVHKGMLSGHGIDEVAARAIVDFMKANARKFRSLTLREATKLARLYVADQDDWQPMALATLSRRGR